MLFVDQQPARVLAQGLLRGVAEQLLGLRAPQHDVPVGVQDHRGDAEQVQQPTALRGSGIGLIAHGSEGAGGPHPRHSLRL